MHLCTRADQSTEFFTRYSLRSAGDVLQSLSQRDETYEYTDSLSPSQLYHICFEGKIAIENAYPGIVQVGTPKTNMSLYGTTHVVDLYKNILLEKFRNGDHNPEIKIHRRIKIVDDKGGEFKLTEQVLWSRTTQLNVKVNTEVPKEQEKSTELKFLGFRCNQEL